jgi:hypothetical protein
LRAQVSCEARLNIAPRPTRLGAGSEISRGRGVLANRHIMADGREELYGDDLGQVKRSATGSI